MINSTTMIPGIRKTMAKILTTLSTTFLIICYCNAGVLPPKIILGSISPSVPTPLPSGKCEYNGKYYDPGVIKKEKNGDCVSDITCMEGGVISIGDSSGCWGSMDKEVAELLKRIADMSKNHETTPKITTPLLFMYW